MGKVTVTCPKLWIKVSGRFQIPLCWQTSSRQQLLSSLWWPWQLQTLPTMQEHLQTSEDQFLSNKCHIFEWISKYLKIYVSMNKWFCFPKVVHSLKYYLPQRLGAVQWQFFDRTGREVLNIFLLNALNSLNLDLKWFISKLNSNKEISVSRVIQMENKQAHQQSAYGGRAV